MRIGVFDSGIGGVTVLKELRRRFKYFDFTYLGDTAHVPYGAKSPVQIESLSLECAQTLRKRGIDVLVVACNTASSWALPLLRKAIAPIPVFGVVEPGIHAIRDSVLQKVRQEEGGEFHLPVLILATRATVNSGAYGQALKEALNSERELRGKNIEVFQQACPLLAPMIEEGWIQNSILSATVQHYVEPYRERGPGIALLGCTHYPWIHSVFEEALPGWKVVNSANAIVHALEQSPLFQQQLQPSLSTEREGTVEWIFTDPQVVPDFVKIELL